MDDNGASSLIGWILAAVVILVVWIFVGWTDPVGATKTLRAAGLTPVSVGGTAWFACGNDDWYATKFKALNVHGEEVSGAVCSGLIFKGTTIRYD